MKETKNRTEERWLYLECYSGISGDMTVGALLDLGVDREALVRALDSLGVPGYHLHFGRKNKCGIDAYDFDVHLEDGEHDHDHAHPHVHRNIHDIFAIIDRLAADDAVKTMAKKIFTIVADAEAKAHGIPAEQVHFHEVGAIDSIVDIVSVSFCLNDLGIKKVVVSPLAEGRGYVKCQHGVMPVPVPATANIAASCGLRLELTDNDGEMVTPTGAAIAAAAATEKELPARYTIEKIGIGAGNKDFKNANILRAMLIRPEEAEEEKGAGSSAAACGESGKTEESGKSGLWMLETNVDDCTGEALGFVMECLMEEGARDAFYTPAYMKKNRPAYVLHVMCEEEQIKPLEAVIFSQTTTIGIRRYQVERTELERSVKTVRTRFGPADIKVCVHEGAVYYYPEYESVRKICREQKLDFPEVYHAVKADAGSGRESGKDETD